MTLQAETVPVESLPMSVCGDRLMGRHELEALLAYVDTVHASRLVDDEVFELDDSVLQAMLARAAVRDERTPAPSEDMPAPVVVAGVQSRH